MFAKAWMDAQSFSEEAIADNAGATMKKGLFFSLVGAFLAAFSLMQFFVFGDGSIGQNIRYALMAWLGFVAATQMGSVYFNFYDKKPGKLFFINTGYNLVGFILIAVIQALL